VILVSVLPCALASSRMRCASVWTATFVGGLGAAALA
jgi:hypothetical protein